VFESPATSVRLLLWISNSTRHSSFRFAFVGVCRGLGSRGFFYQTRLGFLHASGAELPLFYELPVLHGNAPLVFYSMLRLSGHCVTMWALGGVGSGAFALRSKRTSG
jgi:hypothetical protein